MLHTNRKAEIQILCSATRVLESEEEDEDMDKLYSVDEVFGDQSMHREISRKVGIGSGLLDYIVRGIKGNRSGEKMNELCEGRKGSER
jgi:hypothetical protein